MNATSASESAGASGAARLHGEHRRRQRAMRARPVIALAAVAFAIGAIVGAGHGSSAAQALAGRFVAAWAQGDYVTMYGDIDARSKRAISPQELAEAYQHALRIATATHLQVTAGRARRPQGW